MADSIPFCRPDISEREIAELLETLRSGWLTTGPRTRRFEERFAEYAGASQAVALNSCTGALHLALAALGLSEDDEVITTPYTFVASSEVIMYHRARPVFVDVDPETLCIDPAKIEQALGPRTRMILPVHMAGHPAEMDPLLEIARRHGLKVVEDAAHATETCYGNRKVGSIGDATCFSFYATKNLVTGEGGMLTTADPELAERARILSLHGMNRDAWKRYDKGGSWYYEIVETGFKYNMTDLQAALGLVQLERIEEMRGRRLRLEEVYREILGREPELFQLPARGEGHLHAWHLYMLRLRLEALKIDRARFIELLAERDVHASVHFIPVHLHPWYRRTFGYRGGEFPVTEREYMRELSLPFYSALSDAQAVRVAECCLEIGREHRR